MSDNTTIWDALGKTDPSHTKSFQRSGGFKGTAIKPMWAYRRMTEYFGAFGKGWGVNEPQFQVVQGHNNEVLVYCTVSVWWIIGEEKCQGFGVGGDKVVVEQKNRVVNDDEAFKKAFTDAIMNALKALGIGADVHMGQFDDNKYVNELRQEFAADKPDTAKPKAAPKTASKADSRATYERLQAAIRKLETLEKQEEFWKNPKVREAFASLPKDWQDELIKEDDMRKIELSQGVMQEPWDAND